VGCGGSGVVASGVWRGSGGVGRGEGGKRVVRVVCTTRGGIREVFPSMENDEKGITIRRHLMLGNYLVCPRTTDGRSKKTHMVLRYLVRGERRWERGRS